MPRRRRRDANRRDFTVEREPAADVEIARTVASRAGPRRIPVANARFDTDGQPPVGAARGDERDPNRPSPDGDHGSAAQPDSGKGKVAGVASTYGLPAR